MDRKPELSVDISWLDALHNTRSAVLSRWADRPGVDFLIAGCVVGAHLTLVVWGGIGDVLAWADQPQRLAVYAAGAGMMSLIAGFTGNAIVQYGTSTGPIFSRLRAAHGHLVRRTWVGIAAWLLLGTVACIAAMTVDDLTSPRGSQWIFESALAVASAKFARLVYLFNLMLLVIDAQVERPANVLTRIKGPTPVGSRSD